MKIFKSVVLFLFLFAGFNAVVQLKSFAADSSSGCGLGWQVTQSMTTSGSSTRSMTNATSSSHFAMTSGTSGCAKHDLVKNDSMDTHYTQANFEFLVAEAAVGQGEYLSGWARALGCSDRVQATFKAEAQKNFEQVFSNGQTYSDSLNAMKGVIVNNPKLAGQCVLRS